MAENRGGPRPNSGRKPGWSKRLQDKAVAAAVLARVDEVRLWLNLLEATSLNRQGVSEPNWKIRLDSLMYLTDRVEGRPYMADNPARAHLPAHDSKLLVAIQNILPPVKTQAEPNMIEAPREITAEQPAMGATKALTPSTATASQDEPSSREPGVVKTARGSHPENFQNSGEGQS